jgi:hypothetical protein
MEGERGHSKNVFTLSAGAYTTTWLMVVTYVVATCCCVSARFLGMKTKILFSLLWYIQRYLMYIKL